MSEPPIALCEFHGQPALQLAAADGARATVLLHGAQLVSWVPAGGAEQLYLSPAAVLDGRQAVRGGVPVIFPQFNQRGPLPRHGFARLLCWRPLALERGATDALAVLRLDDDADTHEIWPRRFGAELTVRITGDRLDIELAVEHPASDSSEASSPPLTFTAALHTYLRVDDVMGCRLDGLERLRFADMLRNTEQVEAAVPLMVAGALDRIYFDAARPLRLHDGVRQVEIAQQGFADVVVWNPGAEGCRSMADMQPSGWREMLCVEAALIGRPAEVGVGDCWIGRQTLTLLPPVPADAGATPA